jgi:transcriptional regulator with XRE-family HTH domain
MAEGKKHRRNEKAILTVARNVRHYRKVNRITMTELANRLDVDYSHIGRIERGTINTNISMVYDIAEILGVKPSQLLDD